MEVKATIKPGQNGTIKYLKQYGKQLVCVRYRYDKLHNKRQTTIELVVDEQDWIPAHNHQHDRIVALKIGYNEIELREKVKTAGAYWDKEQKAWLLSLNEANNLGLEKRIIGRTHCKQEI